MWINPQALNFLDDSNMGQVEALIRKCQLKVGSDLDHAEDDCAAIMDYIVEVSGAVGQEESGVFPYDARIFAYDWDPYEQITTDYFSEVNENSSTIYTQLHVADSTKTPKFEMGSSAVGEAFEADNLLDYSSYVVDLVSAGVPVLIYAGEFDS